VAGPAEDQLLRVMEQVRSMGVPSMFERRPLSKDVVDQMEYKNQQRPSRPWSWDHIISVTEGCFLQASVFEKTFEWEGSQA